MNLEKVVFGFFVLLALTVNFGFVIGDMDNPAHHHVFELYALRQGVRPLSSLDQ